MIRIAVTSVFVDDQSKALRFYTEILGFEKRQDIPLGDARWLTVASPAEPDGVELLLEPTSNPISRTYQQAAFRAGIPAHTIFAIDNIHAEHQRLTKLGVVFTMAPTKVGTVTQALFDDTCGNLIMLIQAD